jgi:putative membrane protein
MLIGGERGIEFALVASRVFQGGKHFMRNVFSLGLAVVFAASMTTLAAQSQQPTPRTQGTTGQGTTTQGTQQGTSGRTQSSQPSRSSTASMNADQKFVHDAAMGGMAEVELGRLAQQKGSSEQVKSIGEKMVEDHGKANDELKSLAASKKITLPAALDATHKAEVDRLSKLSGQAFDRAYLQGLLRDHQKDVAEFRKQSQSGKDAEVKAWAAKTLPTLETHLKLVQDATRSTSATGTSGKTSATPGTSSRPSTGSTGSTPGTSGTTRNPGSSSGGGTSSTGSSRNP